MYIFVDVYVTDFHSLLLKELDIKHKEWDLGKVVSVSSQIPFQVIWHYIFYHLKCHSSFNHQVGKAIKHHGHNSQSFWTTWKGFKIGQENHSAEMNVYFIS